MPNFKILGAVVPEKSLTKRKVYAQTDTDEYGYRKDVNYIPPTYFVCREYKKKGGGGGGGGLQTIKMPLKSD